MKKLFTIAGLIISPIILAEEVYEGVDIARESHSYASAFYVNGVHSSCELASKTKWNYITKDTPFFVQGANKAGDRYHSFVTVEMSEGILKNLDPSKPVIASVPLANSLEKLTLTFEPSGREGIWHATEGNQYRRIKVNAGGSSIYTVKQGMIVQDVSVRFDTAPVEAYAACVQELRRK